MSVVLVESQATTASPEPPARRRVDKRLAALRRFAVSITLFTVAGHVWLGLETPLAAVVVVLVTAYGLELGLELLDARANRRRPRFHGGFGNLVTFLLPAHISALAIGLLIYPGSRLWPFAFAVAVAIGAKFMFRAPLGGRLRHVLNPSNAGISATLVLFPWVGIAMPYHFTTGIDGVLDWVVPLVVLATGLIINIQLSGRWAIVLGWVVGFAGQAVLRGLFTDVSVVAALAPMTGTAFILFTMYMITDPGTTPARPRNQVLFSFGAAAAYAGFMLLHISFGIFFCLVVACAVRGIYLWAVELASRRRRDGASGHRAAGATTGPG